MPISPLRSVRRHLLVVVLAAALALPVLPAAAALAAPAEAQPASVDLPTPSVALATARPDAVDLTWVAPLDAHRWKAVAFADGRFVGIRTFAGSARSGRIEHLTPGSAITVWVVPVDAAGGWGTWATTPPVTLPRDSACPAGSGTCVHLNGRTTTGPATGAGLGLVHGFTAETDVDRVLEIAPRHWRVSALNGSALWYAKLLGASTTVILSDPWLWATLRPDGRVASPWEDLAVYRTWVIAVAGWHAQMGLVPDRWEIQNEPGVHVFDPAYPMTQDLLVQQHVVAAEAIRSVIPGAEVVGPAVSPVLFGHGEEDLEAFIAKSSTTDLDLGALVWHENTGACATCDGGPRAVLQHIDDARAALRAAGEGDLPIDITESGAPYEQLQPGAIVGYLSAFAEGGVRFGSTTCWDRPDATGAMTNSCSTTPGTLDGLLLADGKTPTDAWWTYQAFAQLSAEGARLATTTVDDSATSAVSAVSGSTVLRALVGRHAGCSAADGPCPSGTTAGAKESMTIRLTAPSAGSWDVVVSRIASTSGAGAAPAIVKRVRVKAGTSPVSVGSFTVADGEVLQVVATRR